MASESVETPGQRSHFDVLVVGPFVLYRDGRPIDASAWQRKVQTLLRLLVTSPGHRRSRDDLVDLLWPEALPDAGARNLRVVLHMLRRGLGGGEPSPIISEGGWVALSPSHEWDIDIDRFEEGVRRAPDSIAALEEVAGFYRGEPLVEDRYDDWATAVRTRVQRGWRDVCLRLASLHSKAHAPEAAVGWLDKIVQSDPLDEEAVRRLVSTLGELGRRTEAIRRYHQFAARLQSEMDLLPAQDTLDVVAALRSRRDHADPVETPDPDTTRVLPIIPRYPLVAAGRLVGREGELGRLLWVLPPLHVGAARLVLVEGGPGMGKTRLLAEVAERARRIGLLTLAGAAFNHEGRILFGPIRDALSDYFEEEPELLLRAQMHGLLPDLIRLIPEIGIRFGETAKTGNGEDVDSRVRLYVAATKAVQRIAESIPVVLLLDDLQWADEWTLQLLHFMVRRLTDNRILVVAAYGVPAGNPAPYIAGMSEDMERGGWATRVTLPSLTERDLASVLEEHIRGRCAPALVASLHTRSGGTPLRAVQLLRSLQQQGLLERSPEGWKIADERLP